MTLSPGIREIMQKGPVIPVVTIEHLDHAIPIADALAEGGISVIEVTLRSPVSMDSIAAIAKNRPGMTVGAGTVLNPEQMKSAKDAGADFAVSPGAYPKLVQSSVDCGLPLLPGAATASEMMTLMAMGITAMKFFPATAAGGSGYLKALAAPLAEAEFCPTGGITPETAADWLALPNVICVGGSWLAPKHALAAGDFAVISDHARACATLG